MNDNATIELPQIKMTSMFKIGAVANAVISGTFAASSLLILFGSIFILKKSLIISLLLVGIPSVVAILNTVVSIFIRCGKGGLRLYRFSTIAMAAVSFLYFKNGAPIGKVGFPVLLIIIVINHVTQSNSRLIGPRPKHNDETKG